MDEESNSAPLESAPLREEPTAKTKFVRLVRRAFLYAVALFLFYVWASTELNPGTDRHLNSEEYAKKFGSFPNPACKGACLQLLDKHKKEEDAPGIRLIAHFLLVSCLLGIIFFADGIEIAYSLLRYKDEEQFGELTRRILKQMHEFEDSVYESRELLVTLLIVVITLTLEFDHVYLSPFAQDPIPDLPIPYFPTISAAKFFSLLFATLPVLWLAQGPAKSLGRQRPQKMLDTSVLVWFLVRLIGRFTDFFEFNYPSCMAALAIQKGLDGDERKAGRKERPKPDGKIQKGLDGDERMVGRKERPKPDGKSAGCPGLDVPEPGAKPSDHAYYIASLQRYGYALHNISVHITINQKGSCRINERLLYYVIARPGSVFTRKMGLDQPSTGFTFVQAKAYSVPLIRDLATREKQKSVLNTLDSLARGPADAVPGTKVLGCNLSVSEIQDAPDFEDKGILNRRYYRVDTHGSIPSSVMAFAIYAEFTTEWCEKAFTVPPSGTAKGGDYFYTAVDCPCYRYTLTVETAEDCDFRLSDLRAKAYCGTDPHWGEQDRLQSSLGFNPDYPHAVHSDLVCPFPATRYRFDWKYSLKNPTHVTPDVCAPVGPAADAEAKTEREHSSPDESAQQP